MSSAREATQAVGIFVGATAVAIALAYANTAYFDFTNQFVAARDPLGRGLLYSSWPVLLVLPFAIVRPAWLKLDPREIPRRFRLIALSAVVAVIATALLVKLTGPTPFSDAPLLLEVVIVPLTEELVFRGVMLSALLAVVSATYPGRRSTAIAVLVDGVAFGAAHLANGAVLDLSFVVAQAAFASVLGIGMAVLVVRTNTVWAAVLVHAAVNATVVLL
jgi:membrane protease YdiL (CAAX protease family)